MKKIISILIIMMLLLSTGCDSGKSSDKSEVGNNDKPSNVTEDDDSETDGNNEGDEKIRIGIVQPIEHPSLNQIRESIIAGLEEEGLKDKVEIIYKDAQGDPSNINTIISQFVGEEMDYIIPIATAPAQSAAATTTEIPIVFAAVSYPVDAGLVEDVNKTDSNITGVSDAIDVNEIFELAKSLTPEAKKFGFIYNSGEVNSVAAIDKAKDYCDANGLDYLETTITNSSELLQASQSLAERVDAIFTPTDNTVASAMPVLAGEAINAGIPVYTGADSMVADGGFATVGVDYTVLGRQVASMVKRLIDGESISENPIETLIKYTKVINTTTAKSLGLEFSKDELKDFQIIE